MLFAETLKLKRPAPRITYGQIKSSRRKPKPSVPYLTLVDEAAAAQTWRVPVEVADLPVSKFKELFEAMDDYRFDASRDDDYGYDDFSDYYDYSGYDYREPGVDDVEDLGNDIVPRLRAKLDERAGTVHQPYRHAFTKKELRAHKRSMRKRQGLPPEHVCWKDSRKTQYHGGQMIDHQQEARFVQHLSY